MTVAERDLPAAFVGGSHDKLRRALMVTGFFLDAGSAAASEPFGTPSGCLIGTDNDAALELIEAGDPAVVLDGARLEFPTTGDACDLDMGGGGGGTDFGALCFNGDREWTDSFTIAFDDDTATITDSKGTMLDLTRCSP